MSTLRAVQGALQGVFQGAFQGALQVGHQGILSRGPFQRKFQEHSKHYRVSHKERLMFFAFFSKTLDQEIKK